MHTRSEMRRWLSPRSVRMRNTAGMSRSASARRRAESFKSIVSHVTMCDRTPTTCHIERLTTHQKKPRPGQAASSVSRVCRCLVHQRTPTERRIETSRVFGPSSREGSNEETFTQQTTGHYDGPPQPGHPTVTTSRPATPGHNLAEMDAELLARAAELDGRIPEYPERVIVDAQAVEAT